MDFKRYQKVRFSQECMDNIRKKLFVYRQWKYLEYINSIGTIIHVDNMPSYKNVYRVRWPDDYEDLYFGWKLQLAIDTSDIDIEFDNLIKEIN